MLVIQKTEETMLNTGCSRIDGKVIVPTTGFPKNVVRLQALTVEARKLWVWVIFNSSKGLGDYLLFLNMGG